MDKEISNTEDMLDTRDIIERIEWLESDEAKDTDTYEAKEIEEFAEELTKLNALMEQMKGMGGDEEWRGDWYPIALIHRSYFEDYAKELAQEIGAIKDDMQWPNNHIDWEAAAQALEMDYTEFDFDGQEYLAR